VLSAAVAAAAFTALVRRLWPDSTVWASRLFAAVAAGTFVTAAFPYGLGLALALVALLALAYGRMLLFALAVVSTLAASPLAFLFLVLIVGCVGAARRGRAVVKPAAVVAAACVAGLLVWRLFPDSGLYPFATGEWLAALAFCAGGLAMTWRVPRARVLATFFGAYAALCTFSYLIPSLVGENVDRLRYAALPITALVLSLRGWRPWPVAAAALALACAWNLSPFAYTFAHSAEDPSAAAAFWRPAIRFLRRELTPDYRVEVVDTAGHWEAVYLARARIPLARGWYRQDDFPQNELLYDRFDARAYRRWLRSLGVRYVVLTSAPADYSARREASLLRSGRSGLRVVFRSRTTEIFAVPHPVPIVTGPDRPAVLRLTQTAIDLWVRRAGHYRVAIRYSPYLAAGGACVARTRSGMTLLDVRRPGRLDLAFALTAARAFAALTGSTSTCPERGRRDPDG
jgi:hypothetical protein